MMENNKNLISVIIPLYNAEKYLKNCITSIVGQTYRNLEIILIDDGSNDNSLSICEKFALQDNRIKVFHQNNGGVASARNKGLSEASGEFIAWVDSDDSIDPEYIEKLYNAVKEYNADISIALKQYKEQIKCIQSREKIVQEYLMGNLTAYLWSTLARRALYNELRFEQLKIGEDALMLCRIYCRAEKLVVFQSSGYHYLERIDSASSKRSFSILKMWLWGVKEQSKIVEDNCPSCSVYMNYKKTIYALSFLIWTKGLQDEGVTLFRKELWDMFHDSIHKLPIFHISLRQYKRVIDLYLEARTVR